MKFDIKNRSIDRVHFTAELSSNYLHEERSVQMGAAVRMAVRTGADLWGADLWGAYLEGADLRHANLRHANLRHADLRHADLRHADLRDADLRHADLRGADLRGADLRGADLRHADLRGADLRGADLRHADLRGAGLRGAGLRGANLRIYQGVYTVFVTPSHVQIGCERRTPEQWLELTEDDAHKIDGERAVEAMRQDGPVIKAMIDATRNEER